MVLALGGFIILLIIILTVSLQQLAVKLPEYQQLLLERINTFTATLGSIGIDVQGALDSFVVDTTALVQSAIDAALAILSDFVAIIFFLFLLFLMLVDSKSIATKFQTRLQTGNNFVIQQSALPHQNLPLSACFIFFSLASRDAARRPQACR
jgi:predicted PurR-regulated permease PerM